MIQHNRVSYDRLESPVDLMRMLVRRRAWIGEQDSTAHLLGQFLRRALTLSRPNSTQESRADSALPPIRYSKIQFSNQCVETPIFEQDHMMLELYNKPSLLHGIYWHQAREWRPVEARPRTRPS